MVAPNVQGPVAAGRGWGRKSRSGQCDARGGQDYGLVGDSGRAGLGRPTQALVLLLGTCSVHLSTCRRPPAHLPPSSVSTCRGRGPARGQAAPPPPGLGRVCWAVSSQGWVPRGPWPCPAWSGSRGLWACCPPTHLLTDTMASTPLRPCGRLPAPGGAPGLPAPLPTSSPTSPAPAPCNLTGRELGRGGRAGEKSRCSPRPLSLARGGGAETPPPVSLLTHE